MGTVGLNFGSLSSGTGFDVASTVTSILALESGIETPWKTQLTSLQAQDTVFSSLGTDLSTLSTSLAALTGFDGVLYSKLGSSSDTNVLSLSSASPSSVAGSHTVTVSKLAQTSSIYSDQVTNKNDTLTGSLQIQIGAATAQTITLNSTDNTLTSLAQAINSGSYGVSASVIQSTTGYRLSLVSSTSGAAGQITLTPSLTDTSNHNTSIGFSSSQQGVDAVLTVDGLSTTSASNTVTGAIPGVTFQLLSVSPADSSTSPPTLTPVQVQITNDNSSVETAFQTLVTSYNAVITDIAGQEKTDSAGAAEPLFGNTTLSLIQTELAQSLLGGAASGAISNIDQLGLTVGSDGKLTLSSTDLDTALNSNFSDIVGFLQNSGSFGQNFTATLNSLGNTSSSGSLALAQAQNSAQEASLNANLTAEDARLATQKTSLTTELNTANQILQDIPSQLSEIDEIYSADTGYNQSTNN